jgi:MFS family permease
MGANTMHSTDTLPKLSAWAPLGEPLYRTLWIAVIASNIGTWMHEVGAGWLMTSLAPSPNMVAMVQAAASFPIFIFALPAGALADIVDRRRLLIFSEVWMMTSAALLGIFTLAGWTTPFLLLFFTLMLGIGSALTAPAWHSIVPEVVKKEQLPAAITLGSLGFNISRTVGPALGGILVGLMGSGITFIINALSFLGVIYLLYRWRRPVVHSVLPTERILGAMKAGLRYVRHAPIIQAALIRSSTFIFFASVMALMPAIARFELHSDSTGYGMLLSCFGLGAVSGVVLLSNLRQRADINGLVLGMSVLFGLIMVSMGLNKSLPAACALMLLAGTAWITVMPSFTTSIQASVPSWVRGRVLSVYILTFFGTSVAGSIVWGHLATFSSIPISLMTAGTGLIVIAVVTRRYQLVSGALANMEPSQHWPAPGVESDIDPERGPVFISVEYRVEPRHARDFIAAMQAVRTIRMRDGAMQWNLLHDAADAQRFVESFAVESWLEHLRQHERVTFADQAIQEHAHSFHSGDAPPLVTHLITSSPDKNPSD